jgi:hypothetical protein
LALALAGLGGEVPHDIFVGVTDDIVALGAIPTKVEFRSVEDCHQIGEAISDLALYMTGCIIPVDGGITA